MMLFLLMVVSRTAKCQIPVTATDTITIYSHKYESEPQFPGGEPAWKNYLNQNLNANVPINNSAKVGTYVIIVTFLVMKDGNISEVSTDSHFGHGMEEEAIRVIKKSPKWIPGSQYGNNVVRIRKQPITFIVSEQ